MTSRVQSFLYFPLEVFTLTIKRYQRHSTLDFKARINLLFIFAFTKKNNDTSLKFNQ